MEFVTYEDFQQLAAKDKYYKQSRWDLYSRVQSLIAQVNPNSVLELGAYRFPLVIGADTMDRTDKFTPTIAHDAREVPWPIEDHAYEMFVALQVWEHLQGCQPQAFLEVKRIAKTAILSFPYQWDCAKSNPSHHGITEETIAQWTLWTPPESIIVVPSNNNHRRIIYQYDFTKETSQRDSILYKERIRTRSLSEPVPTLRRTPEECRYRYQVKENSGEELARCQFIESAFEKYHQPIEYTVKKDACRACLSEHEPTLENFNTVVSALIYRHVESPPEHETITTDLSELQKQAENGLKMVFREPVRLPEKNQPIVDSPELGSGESKKINGLMNLLPLTRQGTAVKDWMVGVTTSPRNPSTINDSLDSIVRAGWSSPWIFMDSAVEIAPRHQHLPVTFREAATGAWSNFYLSLSELVHRNPQADAYLMLQDDVLLTNSENLREYLEEILWPDEETTVISLFCSAEYDRPDEGWHTLNEKWVWGALALIFSNQSAWGFLADSNVIAHRKTGRYDGTRQIDVKIGEWVQRSGKIIYPVPSLAQHIGTRSTLWESATTDNNRRAAKFID